MPSEPLSDRLRAAGQDHLLDALARLADPERTRFAAELEAVDWRQLQTLFTQAALPPEPAGEIAPVAVEDASSFTAAHRERGLDALSRSKVALLVVAGGQGSRLGSDQPKGFFPVGPVSDRSLFQWHAEKVLALSKRVNRAVPFLVMTSPATHAATERYFAEHAFPFAPGQLRLFQQGTMPALDLESGRALLESRDRLALSPNGHGGTLTALADSGLLAELETSGVTTVFYFQVDNPLVALAEPGFLGRHLELRSEVSTKVVFKTDPNEKVGVLALVGGRLAIVEYSDLPKELAEARTGSGGLAYPAGNTAIHLFELEFLKRVTQGAGRLAFHAAKKRLAYYDLEADTIVTPAGVNALKFELFIFDALPAAERHLVVRVDRASEFAPLKNAAGADSPEAVRAAISAFAAGRLRQAGVTVPDGVPLELDPEVVLWPHDGLPENLRQLTITGPRRVDRTLASADE